MDWILLNPDRGGSIVVHGEGGVNMALKDNVCTEGQGERV